MLLYGGMVERVLKREQLGIRDNKLLVGRHPKFRHSPKIWQMFLGVD